jgi:hypothetical protein
MQQFLDLAAVGRVAKYRQAERRLRHEQIAALRLEQGAGRVRATLVIARHDDAPAAVFDDELCAAQHMPGRRQGQRHIADRQPLAIAPRLHPGAGRLAVAQPHHRERLGGRQHMPVAGPRVVGMAVGDDGARHRFDRVDVKPAGLAKEPGRQGAQPGIGMRHAPYVGAPAATASGLAQARRTPSPDELCGSDDQHDGKQQQVGCLAPRLGAFRRGGPEQFALAGAGIACTRHRRPRFSNMV